MKRCERRRTKLFSKFICFMTVIVLIVYIFIINSTVEDKKEVNSCQSEKHKNNKTIKYIFNLAQWRELLNKNGILFKGNRKLWCDVPSELQSMSKAICQIYKMDDCTRLPCRLVYSSNETLRDVKCSPGGRVFTANNDKSTQNEADFTCKVGFSLDLFIKKSTNYSYPSIIVDAFTELSTDLYINILNKQYRSCNSMWGFLFNFESISNYPWTKDSDKSKLIDVSFGYDRSRHDFIPHPWLFNYVEQIKFTSKRLSMQQVMSSKMPINSIENSDTYWTNKEMNSIVQNKTKNESYVKSPILWMNSNCNTKSQRTPYMKKLMKYIDVDNYGSCGSKIRSVPEHIGKIQGSTNQKSTNHASYDWEAGKLALAKDYLFTIAIENTIDYDYVTEKLWHAFKAGSIPIYLGAPNIEDWLPCQTNCIIDLRKFQTPEAAALYIKKVAMNKTLYESYHQWRNQPVSEKFQNMLNYFEKIGNYNLECILCDMSRQVDQGNDSKEYKKKIMKTIGRF